MYSSWFAGWLILFGGWWWEAGDLHSERRDIGVIGAEKRLPYGQHLLVKRAGLFKPPLRPHRPREVIGPFN